MKYSLTHIRRDDLLVKDLQLICVEIKPPNSNSYLLVTWYLPPSNPVDCFKKLEAKFGYLGKDES